MSSLSLLGDLPRNGISFGLLCGTSIVGLTAALRVIAAYYIYCFGRALFSISSVLYLFLRKLGDRRNSTQ